MPDGIEVTWTTSKPDTDVDYTVELTDQYGARYRELELFFWSGDLATALGAEFSASVHDLPTGDEESLDRAPEIAGNSVTMVFPRSAIEREGDALHWRAAVGAAVDGVDRDDWCPDPPPGDDTPEPLELPQSAPGT